MEWVVSLAIFIASFQVIEGASGGASGGPQVPCFFIFGDSLSDSGNNNDLATMAKANYPPYGIDFPGGPTGRFTNGRTTVDLIGDHLGLEGYIPPFPKAKDDVDLMSKGVNYASGSAGIRIETGYQVGMRVHMDQQLANHKEIISKINDNMGQNATAHLNQCLYSMYVGSNDWMLNYFSGGPARLQYAVPELYADALINQLTDQITNLYNMGARKMIVFGMMPFGCLPTLSMLGKCLGYTNGVMNEYNMKLKAMVDQFNSKYADAKFIWINSLDIMGGDSFQNIGLKITNIPCCGSGTMACLPLAHPCDNREDHAYWDFAHPTEASNRVLARRAFKAEEATDTHPMDISSLVNLKL